MTSNQNKPEAIPKIGDRHSQTVIWRYNKELYRFAGSRCRKCGKKHFPLRWMCDDCGSKDLEEIRVSHFGKLVLAEFSVYGTARGYEDAEPYLIASVELDDGIFVEGPIVDFPPEIGRKEVGTPEGWEFWDSLKGRRVRMVFRRHRKLDNGNLAYGYRFKIENPPWRE